MRRTTPLLALAAFLALPATAQAQGIPIPGKAQPRPPVVLHAGPRVQPPVTLGNGGVLPDENVALAPLTDAQVLERMSRIYRYQSEILMAQAQRDEETVEKLLDLAMTELGRLGAEEGLIEAVDGDRYRELYRTILTEYEKYYDASPETMQAQYGDVFAFRADMFAAINSEVPLLENVNLPDLRPVETVFPMTQHRLVDNSIAYLLRSPEKHLYRWIERSETYFPMIEQVLAEEGVPDELKYLAMIESGLNPRANSWAQAGGMWQFIRATGAAYGLDANEWVDERMDPEKATRAAARHLRDLHTMFDGDWQLALAGYNCSPARIKRALRRAEQRLGRKPTFWDIYDDIPRETRNYVPMFIAAALLASNPDALETHRLTPGPEYTYDMVPVRGALTLAQAAEMAGTSESVLQALNPELRRNMVPPTSAHYALRLPVGTSEAFLEAYANLRPGEAQAEVTHTVKRGETLTRVARHYGVSTDALRNRNGLRSTKLTAGQHLVIPVEGGPRLAVATEQVQTVEFRSRPRRQILAASGTTPRLRTASNTSSSTPVRTVSSRSEAPATTSAPTRTSTSVAGSTTSTRVVYRVRRGDTLTEIARKYGTTVGEIRRWNKISGSSIRSGQRLYLYTEGSAPEAAATPAETRTASATTHRVRRGETLSTIARQYGVSVQDVMRANGLSSSRIRSGQRLRIEGGASSAPSRPSTYRVQRGDTLTEIAQKYGVSISDLKRWNNLRGGKILVGQRLKLQG